MDSTTVLRHVSSFLGWSYVPNHLTSISLPLVYKFILRRPLPPPGTPQYIQAYRRIYASVIVSYIVATLAMAVYAQNPNYYRLLGVDSSADEGQLKTAFRNFAKRNHPDKVGQKGMESFMQVRSAYDSLRDPTKRYAYERFGPTAFSFDGVVGEDEYVQTGVMQCIAFYAVSLFVMIVYHSLGGGDSSTLYRAVLFCCALVGELGLYLQPSPFSAAQSGATAAVPFPITILRFIFPRWLPYQLVLFIRDLYVALSIGVTRVIPVVWPETDDQGIGAAPGAWGPLIQRMVGLVGKIDGDVTRILQVQLTSLQGAIDPDRAPAGRGVGPMPGPETVDLMGKEFENYLVESQITSHPMLGTLWRDAILRQRHNGSSTEAVPSQEPSDVSVLSSAAQDQQSWSLSPETQTLSPRLRSISPPVISPTETLASRSPTASPPPSPRSSRAMSLPPMSSSVPYAARPIMSPLRGNSPDVAVFGGSPPRVGA